MPRFPMFLLLGALAACGGGPANQGGQGSSGAPLTPAAKKDVGEPVAHVGNAIIGEEEFRREAARTQPKDGKALSKEERAEVLNSLIEEEVLFQEALKLGLYQDPKVRKILVNQLKREQVYGSVKNGDFSDEELRAFYNEHKSEFVVAPKVQLKRIMFRVNSARDDAATKKKADEVYAEIMGDRRLFATLASEHSDGPYKRRGGDLGFIAPEGKPGVSKAVVEKAFSMKVDAISKPFKADDSYHIVYVVNRREKVERTFEQMKGSVLRMVKQERYKTLEGEFVDKAKGGYEIKTDMAKIEGLELTRPGRGQAQGQGHGPQGGGQAPPTKAAPGGDDHGH